MLNSCQHNDNNDYMEIGKPDIGETIDMPQIN